MLALCKRFSPSGVEEKETLLRDMNEFPACETATRAVKELRNVDRKRRRMEALKLALPDASVILKKITAGVSTVVKRGEEMSFRVQMWRSVNTLDTATTWDKLSAWMKMLEGELSHVQLQEESTRDPTADAKVKALQQRAATTGGSSTAGAGKITEKGGK